MAVVYGVSSPYTGGGMSGTHSIPVLLFYIISNYAEKGKHKIKKFFGFFLVLFTALLLFLNLEKRTPSLLTNVVIDFVFCGK